MTSTEFEYFICRQEFKYAKTMPLNPHWYCLREKCDNDKDFCDAVQFIRDHGKLEKFGKVKYTYYQLGGYKYWTMGNPINYTNGNWSTILINRALI